MAASNFRLSICDFRLRMADLKKSTIRNRKSKMSS